MSDQLNNIERTLGEILGKVEGINKRLDITNGRTSKNEEKISCLQSFQDNLVGKISVIVVLVNVAIMFVTSFLKDFLSK
jgi:hypothetical protein